MTGNARPRNVTVVAIRISNAGPAQLAMPARTPPRCQSVGSSRVAGVVGRGVWREDRPVCDPIWVTVATVNLGGTSPSGSSARGVTRWTTLPVRSGTARFRNLACRRMALRRSACRSARQLGKATASPCASLSGRAIGSHRGLPCGSIGPLPFRLAQPTHRPSGRLADRCPPTRSPLAECGQPTCPDPVRPRRRMLATGVPAWAAYHQAVTAPRAAPDGRFAGDRPQRVLRWARQRERLFGCAFALPNSFSRVVWEVYICQLEP
jgi:hypothetical protein